MMQRKVAEKLEEIGRAADDVVAGYAEAQAVLAEVHDYLSRHTAAGVVLAGSAAFARAVNGRLIGWSPNGFVERTCDARGTSPAIEPLSPVMYAQAVERLDEILDAVAVAISARKRR